MAEQSIRGNSLPVGGVSATSQGSQSQALLPDTATLKRMSEVFMERSEQNCIKLNQASLIPGQQISLTVNNVGLGESLELFVTGSISLANAAGAPQAISLAPEFPFNLIGNILTQFNGQTVINSLSGYELLGIMAKRGKGVFTAAGKAAGAKFSQAKVAVDRSLAYVEAGNADTTLTAGDSLTGTVGASIAANKTGILNFGFYVCLPYTLRQDLLLGLLPMQNNSIYANVAITCPSILGSTPASPVYVEGGVPGTLTNAANAITVQPTYNFWSIPQPNDAALYSFLASHSYMLLSQPNNIIGKTGSEAVQFQIPNNFYLLALLTTLRDSTGALLDVAAKVDNPYLSYNGTARVDRRDIKTKLARQAMYYEGAPCAIGQLLWDATDAEYHTNGVNTTKWLNMYLANNPMMVMDIDASVSLNASYSVLREQLVPANVKIV
jgi:hypothetical protein